MSDEFFKSMMADDAFKKSMVSAMMHRLGTELGTEFKKQVLHEMKTELQHWRSSFISETKGALQNELAHWVSGHLRQEVESGKASLVSFIKRLTDEDETERLVSRAFEQILYRELKNAPSLNIKASLDFKELCPEDHDDDYRDD